MQAIGCPSVLERLLGIELPFQSVRESFASMSRDGRTSVEVVDTVFFDVGFAAPFHMTTLRTCIERPAAPPVAGRAIDG